MPDRPVRARSTLGMCTAWTNHTCMQLVQSNQYTHIFYQICMLSIKTCSIPYLESRAGKIFKFHQTHWQDLPKAWLVFYTHVQMYKLFLFLLMQIMYLWVLLASFNLLNCAHSQGMNRYSTYVMHMNWCLMMWELISDIFYLLTL